MRKHVAKPEAAAVFLGREEWLEDAREVRRRDAVTPSSRTLSRT